MYQMSKKASSRNCRSKSDFPIFDIALPWRVNLIPLIILEESSQSDDSGLVSCWFWISDKVFWSSPRTENMQIWKFPVLGLDRNQFSPMHSYEMSFQVLKLGLDLIFSPRSTSQSSVSLRTGTYRSDLKSSTVLVFRFKILRKELKSHLYCFEKYRSLNSVLNWQYSVKFRLLFWFTLYNSYCNLF